MGKLWYIDSNGKRKRTAEGIRHEYQRFQSSAKAKTERAARNKARQSALKKGLVHKGDNRDVAHLDSNPLHSSSSNLSIQSAHKNRGTRENSRKKGSKRNTRTWGK